MTAATRRRLSLLAERHPLAPPAAQRARLALVPEVPDFAARAGVIRRRAIDVLQLNVGQYYGPFGSLEEGVRVLMLCGRDDPATGADPDRDVLMAQIEDDRVNKRARRYLRDLRRDAVIEYN